MQLPLRLRSGRIVSLRLEQLPAAQRDHAADPSGAEDSGWRIRGTNEAIAEDEGRGEPPVYVAIGAVLNADDRWLHLIDSATGTAFQWDSALQDYFELK